MQINGYKQNFYILSKIAGESFSNYHGNAVRILDELPKTFDEVIIVNKQNPKDYKKITTFRNNDGKVQERVLDYKGKPIKNKIFLHKDFFIGDNEWISSTSIKEYSINRNMINDYIDIKSLFGNCRGTLALWDRKQTRHNLISQDYNKDFKPTTLSSIIINPNGKTEKHNFIEYAPIGSKQKGPIKELLVRINKESKHAGTAKNIADSIKKDEFLSIRGLDLEDAQVPLIEHYIKKRKLEKTSLRIDTDYIPRTPKEKATLIAFYTDTDGSININKERSFKSKAHFAKTAAHETEHAWQWYLHARNTGGDTPYTRKIASVFGPLTQRNEIEEAKKYTDSINNYITFEQDFEQYKNNYIEIMASIKGINEYENYEKQGKSLREMFSHIPPEVL